jgi:hypothetical protein
MNAFSSLFVHVVDANRVFGLLLGNKPVRKQVSPVDGQRCGHTRLVGAEHRLQQLAQFLLKLFASFVKCLRFNC